jgi:hypothetical protein
MSVKAQQLQRSRVSGQDCTDDNLHKQNLAHDKSGWSSSGLQKTSLQEPVAETEPSVRCMQRIKLGTFNIAGVACWTIMGILHGSPKAEPHLENVIFMLPFISGWYLVLKN